MREGEEGQRDICQKWIAVGFRTELVKLLWVVNLSVSLFLGRGQEIYPERQRIDQKNSSGNSAKEVVWIIGKFRASTQKVKNGLRRSFEG